MVSASNDADGCKGANSGDTGSGVVVAALVLGSTENGQLKGIEIGRKIGASPQH
jgi:hypothetical protein